MGKTPKPPKRKVYGSYKGAKEAVEPEPEQDASTPLYSAEDLADMGEAAFRIGMNVLMAFNGGDGVFVTKDVVDDQAVYMFDAYEKYRLVRDSDGDW